MKNFFGKNSALPIGILIVVSITIFFLVGKIVNNTQETEKNISVTEKPNAKCEQQYEKLLSNNANKYENCSVQISQGSFEEKTVERKINNTILIFDASGSMAGKIDGQRKIDIAKDAAKKFISSLKGSDVNLGILVYGHKGSNNIKDKAVSCAGIEELYYIGQVDDRVANNKIDQFQPTGWTPIADSFKRASEMLGKYSGEQYNNSILLVSDGTETCDGDPVAEAKRLKDSGLNVTANVIGFDVAGVDEKRLQEIAKSGGGDYYSVKNRSDFDFAFKKHHSFMEKFDYKMKRLSESLTDIVNTSDTYFECLRNLKIEQAHMVLDMHVDNGVDSACVDYAEGEYQKRYDSIDSQLKRSFDDAQSAWDANNAFKK